MNDNYFVLGETLRFQLTSRKPDGTLFSPDSAKVFLYDPLGADKTSGGTAMTLDSTGVYTLSIVSTTSWVPGVYLARSEATYGTDKVYSDQEITIKSKNEIYSGVYGLGG